MTATTWIVALVSVVLGWLLGTVAAILRRRLRRRKKYREAGDWQDRLIQAEEATQKAEEAARQARRELAQQREAAEALDSALKGCRQRLEDGNEVLEKERARGKKLEVQVQSMLVEQQAELVTLEETHTATKDELAAGAELIGTLESDLQTARRRLRALQLELSDCEDRNRNLLSQIEAIQARPPAPDDLTRLRGIGPAFAKRLRQAGVTSYRQIAGWTEADLEPIAQALDIPVARLRRMELPGQARDLVG